MQDAFAPNAWQWIGGDPFVISRASYIIEMIVDAIAALSGLSVIFEAYGGYPSCHRKQQVTSSVHASFVVVILHFFVQRHVAAFLLQVCL